MNNIEKKSIYGVNNYDLIEEKIYPKQQNNQNYEESDTELSDGYEDFSYSEEKKILIENDELSDTIQDYIETRTQNNFVYKKIGLGSYGKVIKICDTKNKNNNFVVKIPIEQSYNQILGEEIYARKHIDSNYLAKVFLCTQKTKTVMMKCYNCKSNLHTLITTERFCKIRRFNRYLLIHDVLNGLLELEKNKLLHNDIKPGNIIFNMSNREITNFVICDFGFLISYENSPKLRFCGTDIYMSPEKILLKEKNYIVTDNSSDIWSAGVLFLQAVLKYTSDSIFNFSMTIIDEIKNNKNADKIQENIYNFIDINVDEEFKDLKPLLKAMLNIDYLKRPTTTQCLGMLEKIHHIQKNKNIALTNNINI